MKKTAMILAVLLVITVATGVIFASEKGNIVVTPNLKFSGTSAKCTAVVTSSGDSINATMELRRGSTVIDSWSGNGTGIVTLNGSHSVISGQTYSLVVYGTVNGVSFSSTPVTKVCP